MTASEAAAAIPLAAEAGGGLAIGTDALARGLLLVRASAINVVRLQLAMERRDRRVALETVDELMLLDRRISELVGDLSASSGTLLAEARALELQHRALAVERLVLAAGASGPRMASASSHWIEQAPSTSMPAVGEQDFAPPRSAPFPSPEPREISVRLAVAVLMLLAILTGAAAFLFLTENGQAMIAGPNFHQGAYDDAVGRSASRPRVRGL